MKDLQNSKKEHFNFYFETKMKFIFLYFVCVFVCMWICACECWYLQNADEGIKSSGNGGCKPSNMGVLT